MAYFQNCTVSLELLDIILFKPHQIIFMIYGILFETFVKIDSMQHLKISRQTEPTSRLEIRVLTFPVLTLCYFSKLMRTIHTSLTNTC